jgi:hypothetical protein
MKLLFKPVSVLTGRLAGITARRLTDRLWGVVDDGQPPRADQRTAPWQKLAARLAIEGAVFAVVSGLADHASRRWFEARTGRWPGEERPALEETKA